MSTTIGAVKQLSDQPGTIRAAVLLSSDKILPNPIQEVTSPKSINHIYEILELPKDYYIGDVFLISLVQGAGIFSYNFNFKFAKTGVKLDSLVGPQGETGKQGPPGPPGKKGEKGDPAGPAGGDLQGDYPSPNVIGIQGFPVSSATPVNNNTLVWNGTTNIWEPQTFGGVTFGGDLQGDSVTQEVVGIRNVPVEEIITTNNYEVLLIKTNSFYLTRLTQDMILPAFAISSFSFVSDGSLVEVGSITSSPGFIASYTQLPPYDSIVLTDSDGSPPKDVKNPDPLSFNSDGVFQKLIYDQFVTFTLSATKDGFLRTSSLTRRWVQKAYWFTSTAPGVYDQSWVEGRSSGTLVTTKNRTFSVNAGLNEFIYYVYRNGYGDGRFFVGGFEGGFNLVSTISMTRNGVSESYRIYKSINPSLGSTTVTVTD